MLKVTPLSTREQIIAAKHIESGFENVSQWMFSNKLKPNPDKTEFIAISSSRNQSKVAVESISVGDSEILQADTVGNLGVLMDNTLQLDKQISNLRRTCYHYISWIRKVRPMLSISSAKSLIHAIALSRIDYCNGLYINLPDYMIGALQVVLNDAARVVMGINRDRTISITDVLKELHWLPMEQRVEYKILTLGHKAIYGQAPCIFPK